MTSYLEMRKRHQAEVNAFPIKWAFNSEQLVEGMRELGLSPEDMDKVISIGGGFMRKSDFPEFRAMLERHQKEHEDALAADKHSNGYAYEMFLCELASHEYRVTASYEETLDACGLSYEDILARPNLAVALKKAEYEYLINSRM